MWWWLEELDTINLSFLPPLPLSLMLMERGKKKVKLKSNK